jgi:hypothetical protein
MTIYRTDGKPRLHRALPLLVTLLASATALGGDRGGPDPRSRPFLQRIHPVGGWNPDGRGLIHWWDPHCFSTPCGPNDYCPKPIPSLCRYPVAPPIVAAPASPHSPR